MRVKINGIRRGLGPIGARLLSTISSRNPEMVFTVPEVRQLMKIRGSRLRKMLHDLAQNQWIERIENGKYLLLPLEAGPHPIYGTDPFIIARKLVDPYYIGFASALNYYGITEQAPNTIYVVTTKQKRKLVFHSTEYRFIRFEKSHFFGFIEEWIGNLKFRISDKEKTIIDCLYMPEYSLGLTEVTKAFRNEVDFEKLSEYAVRMKDANVIKRLGFMIDVLELNSDLADKLAKKVTGGFALLDRGGKKSGPKNKKWRVIENIEKADLEVEL